MSAAQPMNSQSPVDRKSDIETLADETGMPIATVHEIYEIEHAKLDRVAKIKTYVPVLIRRRVKDLLQSHSNSSARRESRETLLGRNRRVAGGGTAHQEAQGYEQHAEPSRSIEKVQRR
jgi:hypothetical protein